jgi:hypothetical protein
MRAVHAIDLATVRSLIEAGADTCVKDGNWGTSTALDMAKLALRRTKKESDAVALQQIIQELQR